MQKSGAKVCSTSKRDHNRTARHPPGPAIRAREAEPPVPTQAGRYSAIQPRSKAGVAALRRRQIAPLSVIGMEMPNA